jgi:propanediol dehydratase large subunit
MSSRSNDSPNASSLRIAIESSAVHDGTLAFVSSSAAYSDGSGLVASQAFTPSAYASRTARL